MPELPEVETLRRGLQETLVGHIIESVEVRLPRIFTGDPENIADAKIIDVKRFGKGLVIELNNGYSIAVHVKMTGQLVYRGPRMLHGTEVSKSKVGALPNKFTHVVFRLNNPEIGGALLYYNDIRQFGWIKIIKTDQVKSLPFFRDLGPEPLTNLTFEQFSIMLSLSKSPIKPLIMDQKKISGIGNIYANDALYLAGILPTRPANSLTPEEQKKLFDAIETVLKKGLALGGASEMTFVNALGQEGKYQDHVLVYSKVGETCKRCGTKIKKITLGGRGTYYCPGCQS